MKFLILTSLFVTSLFASNCEVVRAAFDIGSGTTKMKVASVDSCKQKIIKILIEEERKVSYKEALKHSETNTIETEILKKGVETLVELKKIASDFNPSMYIGVATSAFRTAINGKRAVRYLERKSDIKIKIVEQEKEAQIGFVAASDLVDTDINNIVVWDIGGGSMQMTTLDQESDFEMYLGKVASVSFKNHVIEQVQFNNIEEIKTPNPISSADYNLARRDAYAVASLTTSRKLRDKLKAPETIVIGIGGVHFYSIASNLSSNNLYTRDEVNNKIAENLGKTDSEIGGEYASTDLSNLILVKGYMDALGIELVQVGNANLATGLLISPEIIE